jgi:hypothetical protein
MGIDEKRNHSSPAFSIIESTDSVANSVNLIWRPARQDRADAVARGCLDPHTLASSPESPSGGCQRCSKCIFGIWHQLNPSNESVLLRSPHPRSLGTAPEVQTGEASLQVGPSEASQPVDDFCAGNQLADSFGYYLAASPRPRESARALHGLSAEKGPGNSLDSSSWCLRPYIWAK